MSRFNNPVPQFWLDNGEMASSGRMYFYENKNYSSLKTTYSQPDNTVPNTNPVKLDGQGRMPPCFGDGLYSVKLYAANPENPNIDGELQWTRDDVSLSEFAGQFELWNPAETYEINDFVKDNIDGNYYQLFGSTISKGEQPSTTPTKWEQAIFLTVYNPNRTYNENDPVFHEGFLYRSLEDNNTDEPPSAKWSNLTFNDSVAGDFAVGGNLTVAGDISSSHWGEALRKTALSYVSNSTLSKDTDLTISGLLTGWYFVSGIIVWNPNGGGASNGIKLTLDNDSSTALQKVTWIQATTASSSPESSTLSSPSFFHTSGDAHITFSGMVRLDSGSSLSIWSSQANSSATQTSILYGSLTVRRVGEGV